MKTIIFNAGSTSIKFKAFENLKETQSAQIDRIGSSIKTHKQALAKLLKQEKIDLTSFEVIGHRIVHGKDKFSKPTLITGQVIKELEDFSDLAPLHNPPQIEIIKQTTAQAKDVKQFAVFDTAFFADLPEIAKVYALPYELYKKGIKKYGFHGISHQYLLGQGIEQAKLDKNNSKVLTIHLGAGCSIAAIKDGKAIDCSLGFTPLEGLIMQTRPGDLDPGIIIYLMENFGYSLGKMKELLNNKSGLLGLTNSKLQDMRDILFMSGEKVEDDNYAPKGFDNCTAEDVESAKLALELFCYRVKKYIGAYTAVLNGVDLIVFGGSIGSGSSVVRDKITKDLGIIKQAKILGIKTNEELEIAKQIEK